MDGLRVGNWIIGDELGSGGCGSVFKAVNVDTNQESAAKVIDIGQLAVKEMMRPKQIRNRIEREVNILRSLDHPHIVKLYEAMEKNEKYYIFMELVTNGELLDYIDEGGLSEDTQKKYFRQIISAVDYCHKRDPQVIHRDLKLENLLVDGEFQIKITDFGFSNFQEGDTLKTMCGTPEYAPPEVFLGRQYMGPPFDMWSAGVILYAMATGYFPFRTSSTGNIMHKEGFDIPDECPSGCGKLIKRLLEKEPKLRPTAEEVLSDPWLQVAEEPKKKKKEKKEKTQPSEKEEKGKEDGEKDGEKKKKKKEEGEKEKEDKKHGEKKHREKKHGEKKKKEKKGEDGEKKKKKKKHVEDGEEKKKKKKKDKDEGEKKKKRENHAEEGEKKKKKKKEKKEEEK
eukprot:CAMPEP_0201489446 /NCGR_PEP_ID=MMETSP0151_2-20130828/22808_1 /ASSEMBLY_ACC=CAM_ASM_000257 /TAXON_ID=200890 /ORGANISM="Paramoeba atlantica, Strain 621/1 / CCAP 1560/9" /LENGTH=395 /DNA_ID=CAMNT_0047875051 /DNA_START=91 /DNA_END=1275 /DNA_ORIENTATION=+